MDLWTSNFHAISLLLMFQALLILGTLGLGGMKKKYFESKIFFEICIMILWVYTLGIKKCFLT